MKNKREKLLTINNLACAVLILVMIGTLLLPCWAYTENYRTKDHTCEICGYYLQAEKLESTFTCPNEVEKVVTTVVNEDGETEEVKEVITADTVVEEGATVITEACGAKKRFFESTNVHLQIPRNASVLDYTWLTFNHEDLTAHFQNYDLNINQLVLAPFLATLMSLFGFVFCSLKRRKNWPSIFAFAAGLITLCAQLMIPAYQLSPYWIYMVASSAALTLVAFVELVSMLVGIVKWCVVPVKR